MRILILPLSCALLSTYVQASEIYPMCTDYDATVKPLHQRVTSCSKSDNDLTQGISGDLKYDKLIQDIAGDCLKSKDWRLNLKILRDYEPGAFKEFLKTVKGTDQYPSSAELISLETFYRRLLNKLDVVKTKIDMQRAETEGLAPSSSDNLSQTAKSGSFGAQC